MSDLLDKQFDFVKKSFDDGVGTVRAMDIKSNIFIALNVFIFVSFMKTEFFTISNDKILTVLLVAYALSTVLALILLGVAVMARVDIRGFEHHIAELGIQNSKNIFFPYKNYQDLSANVKKLFDSDEKTIIKVFIFERAKIQNILESKIFWFEKGALSTYLNLLFIVSIIIYTLVK